MDIKDIKIDGIEIKEVVMTHLSLSYKNGIYTLTADMEEVTEWKK